MRREVKRNVVSKENESEKVEILSLAPFTPNPKLFFEGVQVGSTVSRKLLIENPTSHDVNVSHLLIIYCLTLLRKIFLILFNNLY